MQSTTYDAEFKELHLQMTKRHAYEKAKREFYQAHPLAHLSDIAQTALRRFVYLVMTDKEVQVALLLLMIAIALLFFSSHVLGIHDLDSPY